MRDHLLDPARRRLNFAAAARREFNFLESMGYKEEYSDPATLKYTNGVVEISIVHGANSYELSLEITYGGHRHPFSAVIRLIDPEAAKAYRNAAVRDHSILISELGALKVALEQYGKLALAGDPDFFRRLRESEDVWRREYEEEVLAEQVRPQAEAAFRAKDYATAAQNYKRIEQSLTPAEKKKLELAVKKLAP